MEMIPVLSGNLDSVGYDSETHELFVKFLSGSRYVYRGVPEWIFQQITTVDSPGRFLNENVKGIYPYEQLF